METELLKSILEKLDEHSVAISEHSEDIKSMKKSLAIIEDAVTSKIPALFDAYQANYDKNEEFDNRLSTVENISDTNSLKISILEDTSKVHTKQLAKLLS